MRTIEGTTVSSTGVCRGWQYAVVRWVGKNPGEPRPYPGWILDNRVKNDTSIKSHRTDNQVHNKSIMKANSFLKCNLLK